VNQTHLDILEQHLATLEDGKVKDALDTALGWLDGVSRSADGALVKEGDELSLFDGKWQGRYPMWLHAHFENGNELVDVRRFYASHAKAVEAGKAGQSDEG
jgi:hypothetical protein